MLPGSDSSLSFRGCYFKHWAAISSSRLLFQALGIELLFQASGSISGPGLLLQASGCYFISRFVLPFQCSGCYFRLQAAAISSSGLLFQALVCYFKLSAAISSFGLLEQASGGYFKFLAFQFPGCYFYNFKVGAANSASRLLFTNLFAIVENI